MTRRERLEAKLERRREWASKASARSDAAFSAARRLADSIPFGQPILVGHHSERHARRDRERIHNDMSRGVETMHLAEHHEAAADGLEHALEHSVFSDDPDAIEAIEARIAEHEQKRNRMKLINKLFGKGDVAGLAAIGLDLDKLRVSVAGNFSWDKKPYPAYELTNLGARIRSDKVRIEDIKRRNARNAAANTAPGGVLIEGTGEYCRVTFAEKPERPVIEALKAAGFAWSGGSWSGCRKNLPPEVTP